MSGPGVDATVVVPIAGADSSVPTTVHRAATVLADEFGGRPEAILGAVHVTIDATRLREAVAFLRATGFEHLSDVMAIDATDLPGHRGARFVVVYNLYSLGSAGRLFLRLHVQDGERVPSIAPSWKAATFMEREVFDMFGIEFDGHPDLRKLLTPEDLDGFPLRKDFPIGETPTLFGDGRFLDPASFRAGMLGGDRGRTGWVGGARKGVRISAGVAADDDAAGNGGRS